MVSAGVITFVVGAALWLLGTRLGTQRRDRLSARVTSTPGRYNITPYGRVGHDLRNLFRPSVRERALWLIVLVTAAAMAGYHFEWWPLLEVLTVGSISVIVIGLGRLLVRLSASYPPHFSEHKHTVKLPDGTAIPFVLRVDWQLPRGLTKYDDEKVQREVQARVTEWFVSLKLDPPKTDDDTLALIKSACSKIGVALTPTVLPVLPHGSYLNIAVTDVALSPKEKSPGIVLGVSEGGESVFFPEADRFQHAYIIGKTGTGKTTLLWNAVLQDIEDGKGLCVLDPVGSLVSGLLRSIPKSRVEDVIYFGKDCLIPLWDWKTNSEDEANSVANDMVSIFERITAGWGPRMDAIITESTHALIALPELTFLDLYYFLTDEHFRAKHSRQLPQERREFWQRVFPTIYRSGNVVQPIVTRLLKIRNSLPLRTIFGTRSCVVDVPEIMNRRKVLLVDLSRFDLEDVKALGMFFISKFEFAMRRRANVTHDQRVPFFLTIDEFQDFVFTPLDKFFDRARNFRIALTVSHQRTSQLDAGMLDAALGAGTNVFFGLQPNDVPHFRSVIAPYRPEDLAQLPDHSAIVRLKQKVQRLKTLKPPDTSASLAEQIITRSKERYAVPQYARSDEEKDQPRSAEPGVGPPVPPKRSQSPPG